MNDLKNKAVLVTGASAGIGAAVADMAQHFDNLINGEWLAGASYSANTNPSNLADVLGQYAHTGVY